MFIGWIERFDLPYTGDKGTLRAGNVLTTGGDAP